MKTLSPHLRYLEDESITIIREAVAAAERPVLLYSIGKDSTVILHLLMKAFYPVKPPVPLMQIETGWEFKEMTWFRNETIERLGVDFHAHMNEKGRDDGINPFEHGSRAYAQTMITDSLKAALDKGKYDFIFIGARRDEERSRAKERIFSIRNRFHAWDPKNQRPEFGLLFNTRLPQNHSMRVSPIANWTEMDIWDYIHAEDIPIVPLYFAKERPVVFRNGQWIMIDDDRFQFEEGEEVQQKHVRFRTLGCYPLTAGMESTATTVEEIIAELKADKHSERAGRLVDKDQAAAMERKKRQGYF